MPKRIAAWNQARDTWETGQMDLLSGRLDVFLETWPTSGMTRRGIAFKPPTLVHHTIERECSLLPTPLVTDWKGDSPADHSRDTPQLRATSFYFPHR